jgi:hypothetical protein
MKTKGTAIRDAKGNVLDEVYIIQNAYGEDMLGGIVNPHDSSVFDNFGYLDISGKDSATIKKLVEEENIRLIKEEEANGGKRETSDKPEESGIIERPNEDVILENGLSDEEITILQSETDNLSYKLLEAAAKREKEHKRVISEKDRELELAEELIASLKRENTANQQTIAANQQTIATQAAWNEYLMKANLEKSNTQGQDWNMTDLTNHDKQHLDARDYKPKYNNKPQNKQKMKNTKGNRR